MKKRIIAIIAITLLAVVPAMSQVFLTDDEMNFNRNGEGGIEPGAVVPMENIEMDQFLPLGEGALLLAGLAGAYLVGKRRKEQE